MEIIPAIDIIEGKCVRLTQGDYSKKVVYNGSPLEVAKQFADIGITRLHLVDLDGAKKGSPVNHKVLEQIAVGTNLMIDFGGGIKTEATLKNVFDAGASIATIGSLAVKQKDVFFSWIKKYGAEKFLLGADVKNERVAISGWLETTELNVMDFIKENLENGVGTIFCTDISKDGLLSGSGLDLYRSILLKFPDIELIASGGVSTVTELDVLKAMGCKGAIIGKAIYENRITLGELKKYIEC